MNAFFATTTSELLTYKDYYFKIRETLIQKGVVIHYDWLEAAYQNKLKNPNGIRNVKKLYQQNTDAIDSSDFVVIEYTVPNFSSSHQINYSIFKRKPTLVLRLKPDNTFSDSYIEAIDSPYLTIKDYELDSLEKIIEEFIGFIKLENGFARYNIVLDRKHKYYLDWAHKKYRQSRSEIIRDAIDEKINQDKEFGKYMSK